DVRTMEIELGVIAWQRRERIGGEFAMRWRRAAVHVEYFFRRLRREIMAHAACRIAVRHDQDIFVGIFLRDFGQEIFRACENLLSGFTAMRIGPVALLHRSESITEELMTFTVPFS